MNSRELATLIILGLFVLWAMLVKSVRPSVLAVIRTMVSVKILIPLLGFAVWIGAVTWAAWRLALWTSDLLGATVLWFLLVGMSWFININDTAKDPDFFKRRILAAIGIAAFIEVFVGLQTLPLLAELVLQAFLIVVVALNAFAATKADYKPVARLTSIILVLVGFALLIYTIAQVASHWRDLSARDLLNQFLLPIWLAVAGVLALYPLALYAGYESMLTVWNNDQRPKLRAVLGVMGELRGSLVDIGQFRGFRARNALVSGSFKEARRAVREFKQERAQRLAAEAAARMTLEQYAGISGTDDGGLVLDRREFAATKEALRWLHTCHMGWYQRDDRPARYRRDLLDALGSMVSRGLPEDHGITMRVRKDGKAWYAWRVTPSGHVFAIGADGAPPSQWFYDGRRAPSSFPSKKGGWTSLMEPDRPEWKTEATTGTPE